MSVFKKDARSACLVLASLALAGCGAGPDGTDDEDIATEDVGEAEQAWSQSVPGTEVGYIKAEGAFTCDLTLAGDYPPAQIAPLLERDRMIMSDRKGFLFKHLPIAFDFANTTNGQPNLLGGGRYLWKTYKQAENYHDFVENEFTLDGVQFLDRPEFLSDECHHWRVHKAYNFSDIHDSHVVVRTERFQVPNGVKIEKELKSIWPALKDEADDRDMSTVWLAYNEQERLVTVVYMIDRIVPYDPTQPDFASLGFLESAPALGHFMEEQGWSRTFDRTQWVLHIWHPFEPGDHGEPATWPHSPPFPEPYCGDGVCEVSTGEQHSVCAADCPIKCGDAVCQPWKGENDHNCPGDCGPHPSDKTCH
ncbi:MAG: hypothetical protein WKG00_19540 [Polyangiaceae bacterium]